ncbi:hypothetical protein [Culturomica massiliensis]|uniref:hypothetical protein n=1 Tax=Culturomica massiliensis TaxID=1841857 RepID=UPI0026708D4E|nr:hypothetical protein [Culturomica massiliensis]
MNKTYHQITYTLDSKVIRNSNNPHTVEIKDKRVLSHIESLNISNYFLRKKQLYSCFPNDVEGKLLRRKKCIDIMQVSPFILTCQFVVSEKVKSVLIDLGVKKNEYVLKPIKIYGFADTFYLFFVPLISDTEFIYPKTEWVRQFGDNNEPVIFQDRDFYYADLNQYSIKKLTLPSKYKGYDLLYPQTSGLFLSDRIIEEFERKRIVGYDVINGGCFYASIEIE